ncbi:MAG: DUF2304 family protein [Patescibacteria group bacterium]|nr:DUF2304 family protein [Patescibacteria group bacterium]MDD5490732.1 DUF2304 family protein [Patescibacteria group bacterium]
MLIQFFIVLFVLFVLSRILLRFKKGEITAKELLFWLIFWIAVAVAVLLPQTTSLLASWVGVGRGVDLAIYVAIVVIFYVIFRIFVRLEKIEQDITKVVREMGLREERKNPKS